MTFATQNRCWPERNEGSGRPDRRHRPRSHHIPLLNVVIRVMPVERWISTSARFCSYEAGSELGVYSIMFRMRILTVAVLGLGFLWAAPPPRKISFARAGGVVPGTMHLFVSASDGSDEHPLLAEPHDDYDAVWAPDGK